MINFATIGTNWITDKFIEAGKYNDKFRLYAVHSRSIKKAREFALKHNAVKAYSNVHEMASDPLVNAVYIASPNSLHCEYSKLFLKNKKHVLCEKPSASNIHELKSMLECAYENKVLFMEAYKTLAMPGYDFLTEAVRNIGQIRSVLFNFCQYSSRYDSYLNGAHVNAFNPQFSGGSLMDLGIYCIYPMVSLFGLPEKYYGNSTLLASGSDCEGSSIFRYKNFTVTLIYSKASDSYISNQIQGEKGTILIDKISSPQKIDVIYRNGQKKTYENKCENDMVYEVSEFITCAEKGFMQSNINNHYLSLSVLDIMDGLRKKANIKYPADSFIN